MPNLVHQPLARHEPKRTLLQQVKAVLGLGIVGTLAAVTSMPLLFAPLGPTALLVFAEPEMPTAQPVNVMAGYFIATSFATLAEIWLPGAWWGAVVAVGLAMTLMLLLRVTRIRRRCPCRWETRQWSFEMYPFNDPKTTLKDVEGIDSKLLYDVLTPPSRAGEGYLIHAYLDKPQDRCCR